MTRTGTDREFDGKLHAVTQGIIGVFYEVYKELGYGFVESIYETAMRVALSQVGFKVDTEVPLKVYFRGQIIGAFKADLIVDDCVLIELKTCDCLVKEHHSQTLNYLRSTQIEVALLMNFGPTPNFRRFVMDNITKSHSSVPSASIRVKSSADGGN